VEKGVSTAVVAAIEPGGGFIDAGVAIRGGKIPR
jgi:hypothetical protein